MGLFKQKKPKTWIGRYIVHVGSWGLLAALIGSILAFSIATDIRNYITLAATDATVISIREECTLEWKEGEKRKDRVAESCAQAERIAATSTSRLYRIDRDRYAIVEWHGKRGQTYRYELDQTDSRGIGRNAEPGDTVTIRARGGADPFAVADADFKTMGMMSLIVAFCAWMAWPPPRPGREKPPLIYIVHGRGGKSLARASASWLREKIAGLAVTGAILGMLATGFGAWTAFRAATDTRVFVEATARIVDIETSCRLKPGNGKLMNVEALQKVSCDRAEAIAANRPERHYRVDERTEYRLFYTASDGTGYDQLIRASRFDGTPPELGQTVPIRVDTARPDRIRLARDEGDGAKRADHTFLKGGLILTILSLLTGLALGVRINRTRLIPFHRPA